MASIQAIQNELKTAVAAVQFAGGTAFMNVFDHPADNMDGYPNAVVMLSDGTSGYETSAENQRTDIFEIHVIVSLEDQGLTMSSAFDRVYDLMDSVRDALDKSQNFSGLVLYIDPSAGGVRLAELQNGQNAVGTVRVAVRHLFDITL